MTGCERRVVFYRHDNLVSGIIKVNLDALKKTVSLEDELLCNLNIRGYIGKPWMTKSEIFATSKDKDKISDLTLHDMYTYNFESCILEFSKEGEYINGNAKAIYPASNTYKPCNYHKSPIDSLVMKHIDEKE